jgi:CRISPR/Cas system CSM-associated protein Csm3 (group 7 of RAMP superfamily)
MMHHRWSAEASRKITTRIVLECELVLETPAHFGNGDASEMTDLPVAADFLDGKTPVLTGASIAGALRSYLVAREKGYEKSEIAGDKSSYAAILFGGSKGDDKGKQSPLIIEDAFGQGKSFAIETREGVSINAQSRTAEEKKLYSRQLWEAGTTFKLRFELLLNEKAEENEKRKRALATALAGFSDGSITIGARKCRGYGRVRAQNWKARTYDLCTKDGILNWLKNGGSEITDAVPDLATALSVTLLSEDQRREFRIDAEFTLEGSMLIRGSGAEDVGPDMQHLHSKRNEKDKPVPIISGTSLAGALRARAEKIANTITQKKKEHEDNVRKLVEGMFGSDNAANGHPLASRLIVSESEIAGATNDLVQNRVSIDRFTGGALDTALFTEAPVFKTKDTRLKINLRLQNPKYEEIGLLLLLLKDLWTSDLAIGGEASVGRGRLRGKKADLTLHQTWSITQSSDNLAITPEDGAAVLQGYVKNLNDCLLGKKKEVEQ